jgi:ribosomal protein S18 acetylase RimI-like enzyme
LEPDSSILIRPATKADLSALMRNLRRVVDERAMNLYKAIGFEVEGVLRNQYLINGVYVNEVVMGLFVKG